MGEFESNMKYARSIGHDISKPTLDRRTTSQRITDEMREMKKRMCGLESDILTLVGRLYGENDETFAPETYEVMKRWRPIFKSMYLKDSDA